MVAEISLSHHGNDRLTKLLTKFQVSKRSCILVDIYNYCNNIACMSLN